MTQQPYQPKPQKRSPIVTILIVIAVIAVGGFILGKTAFPTTPSAPITVTPTATDSNDSDFLFVVADDLSTEGMVGMGLTDADIVRFANQVCTDLSSGSTEKDAAKTLKNVPWLVAGTAADFVSSAHTFYCPEV